MSCNVYYRREVKDVSFKASMSMLLAAIMTRPSTPRELTEQCTIKRPVSQGTIDNVRQSLASFHNFGVIRVIGKRRAGKRTAYVFAMQSTLFGEQDDFKTLLDENNNPVVNGNGQ